MNAKYCKLNKKNKGNYIILKYNKVIIYYYYITIKINKNTNVPRHRNNPDYTLSRSYQLCENEVFLRMFIPFAVVYTSFLCVYHLSQFFVRGIPIEDVAVRVSIIESFYVVRT